MTKKDSFESMNQPDPEPKKVKKPAGQSRIFDTRPFYYETNRGRIVFFNRNKQLLELSPKEFGRYVGVNFGVDISRHDGKPSNAEKIITSIQDHNVINAVTSLAGHFGPKIIHHGGQTLLVKDAPNLITPKEGDWPTLALLLSGMLDSKQYDHNLWWTHQAVDDLYNRRCTLGTAPVWCGPHSAGKSRWQDLLTLILGGRMSRPYESMTGKTSFNAHTFAAEHLMIEDEHSASDLKSRMTLGAAIKAIIANQDKQSHAKYQMPFMVPPLFQRLTISLNDTSANVALLPPSDVSLDHKISLYDVACVPMPMPTGTSEEQAIFRATLVSELPAFIWDLLHQIKIPEEWRDNRFGVKVYRAPRVLELMDEHEPYVKLLELIDIFYFGSEKHEFETLVMDSGDLMEGSAAQIEADLRHPKSCVKAQADDLLRGQSFTGRYLQKLVEKRPDRVSFRRTMDAKNYTIRSRSLSERLRQQ
jgi:hypothetical protein